MREQHKSIEERRRQRQEARAGATYRAFLEQVRQNVPAPPERAEQITVAVMEALDQRLPWDEMADLASELPANLRELLGHCVPSKTKRARDIGKKEFLEMVARELGCGDEEAERYTRGVFQTLAERVSEGEIRQVVHLLPKGLRALWPSQLH